MVTRHRQSERTQRMLDVRSHALVLMRWRSCCCEMSGALRGLTSSLKHSRELKRTSACIAAGDSSTIRSSCTTPGSIWGHSASKARPFRSILSGASRGSRCRLCHRADPLEIEITTIDERASWCSVVKALERDRDRFTVVCAGYMPSALVRARVVAVVFAGRLRTRGGLCSGRTPQSRGWLLAARRRRGSAGGALVWGSCRRRVCRTSDSGGRR